ncbi:O-methyltransferase [Halorubellus sp. PRR65]|uniref:O-methyltransferase n=1 Tax=Halorubellus sp. PRR65 TaxID=3098148 RepID=UPI002B260008|nr:O-methyltransferase [Halorubellus sp. PRR65]
MDFEDVSRFVEATAPEPDALAREMDAYAAEQGFPHVGPAVGGTLRLLARMVDAERVFEFGSGFGYSAYWWAQALPDDGEVVLTEFDADELDDAREFMTRGGFDDVARYEHGDAMAAIDRYDGPFDAVLIDHQKERYADAFHAVREKVAPGGVVVADNTLNAGIISFDDLLAHFAEDESLDDASDATKGIVEYLHAVRDDDAFETVVLPLGEGIAVSYRVD